jgi:hypothetical protein
MDNAALDGTETAVIIVSFSPNFDAPFDATKRAVIGVRRPLCRHFVHCSFAGVCFLMLRLQLLFVSMQMFR